jgi:hypothetical protein
MIPLTWMTPSVDLEIPLRLFNKKFPHATGRDWDAQNNRKISSSLSSVSASGLPRKECANIICKYLKVGYV